MPAEIISIGDELTSGQRLDTNSQWLSERLGELGIRVVFHTTVADDIEANVRVFREAFERAYADGFMGTDETQLVERIGHRVSVVEGSTINIKITRPFDLRLAEAIQKEFFD